MTFGMSQGGSVDILENGSEQSSTTLPSAQNAEERCRSMKSAGTQIFRTSFSYGNIGKEQVAKYLYYPTFNIPYLFSDSYKVQMKVQSPPPPLFGGSSNFLQKIARRGFQSFCYEFARPFPRMELFP